MLSPRLAISTATSNRPHGLNLKKFFPPASEMLPVANGILHLPSGNMTDPTASYFGLKPPLPCSIRTLPSPHIGLHSWTPYLNSDSELIEALQDWFGYVLAADTSQQKMLLIVGPKRSGKGTIGRSLKALLGNSNVVSPTLASLQTNFGLSPLIAKPLAVISDARLGHRTDQANIAERCCRSPAKMPVTIDRKYGSRMDRTIANPLHNRSPMSSRASPIPQARSQAGSSFCFCKTAFYGSEDHNVARSDCSRELSGILNWGLVGYRRCARARALRAAALAPAKPPPNSKHSVHL